MAKKCDHECEKCIRERAEKLEREARELRNKLPGERTVIIERYGYPVPYVPNIPYFGNPIVLCQAGSGAGPGTAGTIQASNLGMLSGGVQTFNALA